MTTEPQPSNGLWARPIPALPPWTARFDTMARMGNSAKDRATMEAIGSIYCRGNHEAATRGGDEMCPWCREAIEGTLARANACPYGHAHNCEDCETHCQKGESQQNIKAIMAYAAPRMLLRHPFMTLGYLRKKLGK